MDTMPSQRSYNWTHLGLPNALSLFLYLSSQQTIDMLQSRNGVMWLASKFRLLSLPLTPRDSLVVLEHVHHGSPSRRPSAIFGVFPTESETHLMYEIPKLPRHAAQVLP